MLHLVFTTSESWLSKAIRALTRSGVSHVALATDHKLIHMTEHGVTEEPRELFLRAGNRVVAEYRILVDIRDGVEHARKHMASYDYASLLGQVFVLFGIWKRNILASPYAMVCSEFVLHADHDGRVVEWKGLDPERTTPAMLLERCKGPSFERVIRR